MKGGEKLIEAGDADVLQGINLEELGEGFANVSVVIPEGVVKIEEEVLVGFQNGLIVCTGCFGFYLLRVPDSISVRRRFPDLWSGWCLFGSI